MRQLKFVTKICNGSKPELIHKANLGPQNRMALAATTLPNGLRVQHVSKQDLHFLYEEVMQQASYLQHGVQLHRGDVVLDIGAALTMHACMLGSPFQLAGSQISSHFPLIMRRLKHRAVLDGGSPGRRTRGERLLMHASMRLIKNEYGRSGGLSARRGSSCRRSHCHSCTRRSNTTSTAIDTGASSKVLNLALTIVIETPCRLVNSAASFKHLITMLS